MSTDSTAFARPLKRSRSLTQEVVSSITEQIRNNALRPGDKLPTEAELIEAFGVSRTVIREAISRLQAAGLVETRHGIGSFVQEAAKPTSFGIDPGTVTTVRDILALLELRISLETETAWLAATRHNDTQLKKIRQALDDFQATLNSDSENTVSDFQFHMEIAGATGNPYFVDIMNHLGSQLIPRTRINTAALARDHHPQYLERIHREHEDIYEAIARRDPEAARAAMRTHLTNSRERLRRAQMMEVNNN